MSKEELTIKVTQTLNFINKSRKSNKKQEEKKIEENKHAREAFRLKQEEKYPNYSTLKNQMKQKRSDLIISQEDTIIEKSVIERRATRDYLK